MKDETKLKKYFKDSVVYKNEWIECSKEILDFFKTNNTIEKLRNTLKYVDVSVYRSRTVEVSVNLIQFVLEKFYPEITDIVEKDKIYRTLEKDLSHIKSTFHYEYISCKFSISEEEVIDGEKKIIERLGKSDVNLQNILSDFYSNKNSRRRFKLLVDYTLASGRTEQQIKDFLNQLPIKYRDYYLSLGPDRIRANGYIEAKIRKEWKKLVYKEETKVCENMILKIYSTFEIGKKYGKAKIKLMLKDIYSSYNYKKTAKASDLTDYFVLRTTSAKEDNKWVSGFEILGKR